MSVRRLWTVVRKEVAQLRRDRRTLATMLTLPVVQLILYGYLNNEVLHQPTAVWDPVPSAESRALVAALENTRYFAVRYRVRNLRELERLLDSAHARVGVVVPPDYGPRVRAGRPATILVVVDASDATSARVVLQVAQGLGVRLSQDLQVRSLARRGQRPPPQPVEVRTRAWYNPDLRTQVFIVPGVLGAVMQFVTTFLTLGTIVRERELGTFEQLVATPLRPVELMLGKLVPLVGLAYLNLTFILLVAWGWFGVAAKGSLLLLYVLTFAFFFSSLGLGTLISTVSRTFVQAAQLAQLILLPSILLSGFLFPRESLPPALQYVGLAIPLTYYVTVVRGIFIKGVGLEVLWPQVAALLALGIVVFGAAIVRFQKKLD
ncbi:MAG: ABC transporter permease [Armatimonadota bacterium]|nr:ABC transporter permease [Armatimonadota bacterium]MDR5675259.1 ABC transporter permease [Armatimonadota bacterium]MDR7387824.1 ABC transporter permease [Armatimonadota bacterium]MDR7389882.1 ABC transporter permease [Armatimonadota bacterium]MDR7391943.1 ABC transporter permease [Armatimonadota bacterium]